MRLYWGQVIREFLDADGFVKENDDAPQFFEY